MHRLATLARLQHKISAGQRAGAKALQDGFHVSCSIAIGIDLDEQVEAGCLIADLANASIRKCTCADKGEGLIARRQSIGIDERETQPVYADFEIGDQVCCSANA